MSGFDLELLSGDHDRKGFRCGSEPLERYLRETAKSHLAKGVSITRVMVERNARKPKPVLGYFTLTSTLAKAADWPGVVKGLPAMLLPIVLLGRLAVAEAWLWILPKKDWSSFAPNTDLYGSMRRHCGCSCRLIRFAEFDGKAALRASASFNLMGKNFSVVNHSNH